MRASRGKATRLALLLGLFLLPLLARPVRADATYANLAERALERLRVAESHHKRGADALAVAQARESLELLEQAESLRPHQTYTALLAVQASVFADDLDAARRWLEAYARRTPYGLRDPDLHYSRALVAHFLEDRPDIAIRSLERMQALDPRARADQRDVLYYAALVDAGRRYARMEAYIDAIRHFRTAALVARRRGERRKELAARANVGTTMDLAHRYLEAAEVFDALRQEEPGNALWHWYYGLALGNQTLFEKAIPVYEHVIGMLEAGGDDMRHRDLLEAVYLRIGNCWRNLAAKEMDPARRRAMLATAQDYVERYVREHPDMAVGHYWLGLLLYEELERPYEALEHFERAFALDPVCDHSLRMMVQIATRHGPPPGEDGEVGEAEQAAWRERRQAWQEDLEANAQARLDERLHREETRENAWDGCL